jgi:8-oxo-dGTP pyrophosphatase MutT (NUDIX family)
MHTDFSLEDLREHASACSRSPITRDGYRKAAVLIPLVQIDGVWHILFTRRNDDLPEHSGQIAFPGGSVEEGERPEETALREAWEETGIRKGDVEILGVHADILTPTGFIITPVIGYLRSIAGLRANPGEVVRIFTAPLTHFTDTSNCVVRKFPVFGELRDVYFYHYDGETIWGATALMLRHFLACLGFQEFEAS